MRRFFLAWLLIGFVYFTAAQAQNLNTANFLKQVLELPAPPPVNESDDAPKRERPNEFFAAENVPPDDAPIEDLIDYWEKQNYIYDEFRYNLPPSKETVRRLLGAIENDPKLLPGYLKLLPTEREVADAVKRIYQSEQEAKSFDRQWSETIKNWLRYNSDMFIDELTEAAKNLKADGRTIPNQDALISLAQVDWERARPIVETYESNPSQSELFTLAKYVLYQHALKTEDSGDIERYREDLKKLVENQKMPHKTRDLAMDALVLGGDFEGRDEWYLSLLEDETLLELQENGYTGLTTLVRHSPQNRDKWLPAMLRLLDSGSPALRSVAVRNIAQINGLHDKEILKKMLPWLDDAKWIKESREKERGTFIEALGDFDIPESIPGLIAVVSNPDEEYRSSAARALIKYKSVEATGVLRKLLLTEKDSDMRRSLIEALIAVNGFSDEEMIGALENYAVFFVNRRDDDETDVEDYDEEKPPPLELVLGYALTQITEPTDGLASLTIARIEALRKSSPAAADFLNEVMEKWQHPLVDLEMLGRLKSSKANTETVVKLLTKRDEIRERVPNELAAMRDKTAVLRGISAVILKNEIDFRNILGSPDLEARAALLAFGRLVRLKLPVSEIAPFLKSENKLLALAAERFLETDDSAEARTGLLAHFKTETRLFGARIGFVQDDADFTELQSELNDLFKSVNDSAFSNSKPEGLKKREKALRQEIAADPNLVAVYAVIRNYSPTSLILRQFKDKVVFSFNEDDARYWEKTVSAKEYEAFMRYIIEKRIDDLAPVNNEYAPPQIAGEFLMFGRDGGRRVYFQGYGVGKPLNGLMEIFNQFNTGERRLRYRLADKIDGLEVLSADENLRARAIWKNGADFRVLVEDKERQKTNLEELERQESLETPPVSYEKRNERRIAAAYKHFSWQKVMNGKISDQSTSEPVGIKYLTSNLRDSSLAYNLSQVPDLNSFMRQTFDGEVTIFEGDIYKYNAGGAKTLLKEGIYQNPIVSTDKKWIVVAQADEGFYEPNGVVRINLQTGKESKINIAPADDFYPVAAVPSQNKILLYRAADENYGARRNNPSPKSPEYYLLDPATGAAQLVKGEFRPLVGQTFRGLQPTAAPNEFWAAIYDEKQNATEIGFYNTLNFSFKSVMKLPEIVLGSMNVWIDEAAAKVFFVYQGHLLAAPLPKQTK